MCNIEMIGDHKISREDGVVEMVLPHVDDRLYVCKGRGKEREGRGDKRQKKKEQLLGDQTYPTNMSHFVGSPFWHNSMTASKSLYLVNKRHNPK
jgi:hypothetical protein